MNTPKNREQTAEIMFETFNCPGMYIGVSAVLAVAASWTSGNSSNRELSGTVVDAGEGLTHVVPVVDGKVFGSAIQQIPLGGKDLSSFVQQLMRDRKEPIPADQSSDVARITKEKFGYITPDVKKEFSKYDSNPNKYIRKFEGIHKSNGQRWSCKVMHERFLAGEAFFKPEVRLTCFIFEPVYSDFSTISGIFFSHFSHLSTRA